MDTGYSRSWLSAGLEIWIRLSASMSKVMAHAQRAPFGHGIGFFIMSIAYNIECLELASIDLLRTKFHDWLNYLVLAPDFGENTGLIFPILMT